MTDHPSSDRDELVVAYLDGEAAPAERAIVEADPELMARVEILGEVMAMVGEPVMPPPPEVKRAHIAAALDVSATAPNVTSMSTRRRRFGAPQLAAAAAVVIALFAIPVVLTSGGDDDTETAATVASGDDAASAAREDFAGDDGSASDAAGAELFDGGELEASAEDEPAEEAAEEPAMESAEAPAADELAEADQDDTTDDTEGDAEPQDADDGGGDGAADEFVVPRLDVELAPGFDELALQVLPPPSGTIGADVDEGTIDDLNCVVDRAADTGADDVILQAGRALVGNQFVQYVVVERLVDDTPVTELIVFDEICAPVYTDQVG